MPHKRKLIISVIVSVAAYLLWVVATDARAVWTSASQLGWLGLAWVLLLSLVNYGLRFARWHGYLALIGQHVPRFDSLRFYVAGFALTTTPGKAGEAIRSLFLRRHGVPYSGSLAALFAERLADILSVALIAVGGVAAFPEFRWMAIVVAILAAAVLSLVRSSRLRGALARWVGNREGRLQQTAQHGFALLEDASRMLGLKALAIGIGLGVVAWGAEAFAFAYIVESIGYPLPVVVLAAVYALSMLAGAFSFMPGGLGGAEAAMGVMLYALGLDGPDIVSATLICRLTTLWFAVLLGLFALGSAATDDAVTARALSLGEDSP